MFFSENVPLEAKTAFFDNRAETISPQAQKNFMNI